MFWTRLGFVQARFGFNDGCIIVPIMKTYSYYVLVSLSTFFKPLSGVLNTYIHLGTTANSRQTGQKQRPLSSKRGLCPALFLGNARYFIADKS